MTLTEVIDGLLMVTEHSDEESDAVIAAMNRLLPHTQPITPEGLEARGFESVIKPDYWSADSDTEHVRHTPNGDVVYYPESQKMCLFTPAGQTASLPGVRTLGDVDDLIRMLGGGDGA